MSKTGYQPYVLPCVSIAGPAMVGSEKTNSDFDVPSSAPLSLSEVSGLASSGDGQSSSHEPTPSSSMPALVVQVSGSGTNPAVGKATETTDDNDSSDEADPEELARLIVQLQKRLASSKSSVSDSSSAARPRNKKTRTEGEVTREKIVIDGEVIAEPLS